MLLAILLHQNYEALVANRENKQNCDLIMLRGCDMNAF